MRIYPWLLAGTVSLLANRGITERLWFAFASNDKQQIALRLVSACQKTLKKLYIYRCKLNGSHPVLRVLKAKIKVVYDVEMVIAIKRSKVDYHI